MSTKKDEEKKAQADKKAAEAKAMLPEDELVCTNMITNCKI